MVLDSAWRSTTIDVNEWLQKWGVQRCGADSAAVKQAWSLLGQTVYAHTPAQTFEHHMKYCTTNMPNGSIFWDNPMFRSVEFLACFNKRCNEHWLFRLYHEVQHARSVQVDLTSGTLSATHCV
jgi:hypothetical protein